MGFGELKYTDGQTPLDPDEKDGLIIPTISKRSELDEVEQRNIEEAIRWTIERRKRFTIDEIFTEQFVKELHKRMFGEVWDWAGHFRNTNKNIGIDKHQIGINLKALLDDCRHWIENKAFSEDEIAILFKHRIVSIHCFPNGNGRHSRLIADVIIEKVFDRSVFTWGSQSLIKSSEYRANYIAALREADKGNIQPLILFARS